MEAGAATWPVGERHLSAPSVITHVYERNAGPDASGLGSVSTATIHLQPLDKRSSREGNADATLLQGIVLSCVPFWSSLGHLFNILASCSFAADAL